MKRDLNKSIPNKVVNKVKHYLRIYEVESPPQKKAGSVSSILIFISLCTLFVLLLQRSLPTSRQQLLTPQCFLILRYITEPVEIGNIQVIAVAVGMAAR
jgi:hypothetical protein